MFNCEIPFISLNKLILKYFPSENRVSHEESEHARTLENSEADVFKVDAGLHETESILSDFTRLVTNSERLIHIYTLTGIIVATIIITLCRSFYFFSVSIFDFFFVSF